jgi:dienelactone hydrolase
MRIVFAAAMLAQLLYPTPPSAAVTTLRDVAYAGDRRVMDVYRPSARASASARPALIVFTAFATAQRREPQPVGWATAAAVNDIVGVVPDVRPDHATEDVDAVLAYLAGHSAELDVDPQAVALVAYSGYVQSALPLVEDPRRAGIHAAVMLYGGADVAQFRRDLPVLIVRAGLDRPGVNRDLAALAASAIAQNAPVTILNHPTGHHGFEIVDDDDATRSTIEAVLAFVKRTTPAAENAKRPLPARS